MKEEASLYSSINFKCETAEGVFLRAKGAIASLVVSIPTGYALFFVLSHTIELYGENWIAFVPVPWSVLIGIFGWFYPKNLIAFIQIFWKVLIIFQILSIFS